MSACYWTQGRMIAFERLVTDISTMHLIQWRLLNMTRPRCSVHWVHQSCFTSPAKWLTGFCGHNNGTISPVPKVSTVGWDWPSNDHYWSIGQELEILAIVHPSSAKGWLLHCRWWILLWISSPWKRNVTLKMEEHFGWSKEPCALMKVLG